MPCKERNISSVVDFKKKEDTLNEVKSSIFATVFEKSSVIGLSQIFTTRSIVRKLCWCIVLVTGLTFCAIESHKFIKEFQNYPVVVNIEINNSGELPFPAVTVCNLNSVKWKEMSLFPTLFDEEFLLKSKQSPSFRRDIIKCDAEKISRIEANRIKFYNTYFNLSNKSKIEIGHQMEDFIESAKFNTRNVELDKNVNIIIKPRYGPCYTFKNQPGTNESERIFVSRGIGVLSGLTLHLNLEVNEYMPYTKSVGALIVVHSPDEIPDTEGNGVHLEPGKETSIIISKQNFKRLPFPYKDKCKDYKNEAVKGSGTGILSQKECMIHCLQQTNIKECGCTDSTLHFSENTKKCQFNNKTEVCCLDKIFEQMLWDDFLCNCPLECESTYAKINIYYGSLEEITYVQKPVYQNSEWYSHMGGQLGLWLGISLPAIFDCLETIVLLLYRVFKKV